MAHTETPPDDGYIDTNRFERVGGVWRYRPGGTFTHSEAQMAATTLLTPQAKALGMHALPSWSISPRDALHKQTTTDDEWLTPDVLVGGSVWPISDFAQPPCLLAVEVMLPEQNFKQMKEKAGIYFEWGVEHVWVIDPQTMVALMMSKAGEHVSVETESLQAGALVVRLQDLREEMQD